MRRSNAATRQSSTTTVREYHSDTKNGGTVHDPMAVNWTEKYNETLEKYWTKLPSFLASCLATIAVFLLGAAMNGEWLLVVVHIMRQMHTTAVSIESEYPYDGFSILGIRLDGLQYFFIGATAVSWLMYYGIGGFLHWYFYVRRRDTAHEWKCQPKTWMSPELERHEIAVGSFSLLLGSALSAVLACHIYHGGWSQVYYNFSDHSSYWTVLQWPAIFLYQDYLTYWHHRFYHIPLFYKSFHKLHHKYKQPTAFSVTAIHPVEFMHMQLMLVSPMFLFPIHWLPYSVIVMYVYYHGIIDHSGINFKAFWWQPWQPDAIFHDNHHQYFHVNFGFNCWFWDKLHGTHRRKDRFYTEDIFYGRGKPITEASPEELAADMNQRKLENPLAYRSNELEFDLTEDDIRKSKTVGSEPVRNPSNAN